MAAVYAGEAGDDAVRLPAHSRRRPRRRRQAGLGRPSVEQKGRMQRPSRLFALALATLLIAGIFGANAVTAAAPPSGAGCSTTRHAVAHHPGGAVVSGASGAPIPCATETGYGGAETRIAVTADGTVVYEPAAVTPGIAGT